MPGCYPYGVRARGQGFARSPGRVSRPEGGCVIYKGQSEAVIYGRYLPGSVRSRVIYEFPTTVVRPYMRGACLSDEGSSRPRVTNEGSVRS